MKQIKTGVKLIADERKDQIEKHGYTTERDSELYEKGQLIIAAEATITGDDSQFPSNWDLIIVQKICDKPLKERLVIAAAFLAAEIDRLNFINKNKQNHETNKNI